MNTHSLFGLLGCSTGGSHPSHSLTAVGAYYYNFYSEKYGLVIADCEFACCNCSEYTLKKDLYQLGTELRILYI